MSNLSDRGTLRGSLGRVTDDYNNLINKPSINGNELVGDQGGHELGLANEDDIIYIEANPLGPAAADLHKILVDDTIYSIPDVVVYGTASGAIASFDDGGNDKPLKSLKVAINPVQSGSGDSSPENPIPISGWTGADLARDEKNLINFEDITEPKTANVVKGVDVDLPRGNYVISFDLTNVNRRATVASYIVGISDKDSYITNYTTQDVKRVSDNVTMQSLSNPINGRFYVNVTNKSIHRIVFYWRSNTYMLLSSGAVTNIMLHQTDKSFTPYQGTTYPITWSEAGEVFGGELEYSDFVWSAEKTYKGVDLGNLNWTKHSSGSFFYASLNDAKYETGAVYTADAICSDYVVTTPKGVTTQDYSFAIGTYYLNNCTLYVRDTRYLSGTAQEFKQAMNGVILCYALATPIPFTLDEPLPTIKTLLGNNNIWSDTGEIEECVYQRDLNIVINKLLQ